jgi:hypothetical protein
MAQEVECLPRKHEAEFKPQFKKKENMHLDKVLKLKARLDRHGENLELNPIFLEVNALST